MPQKADDLTDEELLVWPGAANTVNIEAICA
jgi:hypothetical protein